MIAALYIGDELFFFDRTPLLAREWGTSPATAYALLQQVQFLVFLREGRTWRPSEQHRLASALDVHGGVVVAVQVGCAGGVGTTAQPSNRPARRAASPFLGGRLLRQALPQRRVRAEALPPLGDPAPVDFVIATRLRARRAADVVDHAQPRQRRALALLPGRRRGRRLWEVRADEFADAGAEVEPQVGLRSTTATALRWTFPIDCRPCAICSALYSH